MCAPKLRQTSRRTYEAALDLGASPLYAFFKVTFPDILPGVLSGFMLAFTMSLDDFVITHFTKGPGVDTLSTKIYSEVRKGIKPEMYALSTLHVCYGSGTAVLGQRIHRTEGSQRQRQAQKTRPPQFQSQQDPDQTCRSLPLIACYLSAAVFTTASKEQSDRRKTKLIVYNWGEYMDPDVITDV